MWAVSENRLYLAAKMSVYSTKISSQTQSFYWYGFCILATEKIRRERIIKVMRQLKIERSITNRQNESLDKYLSVPRTNSSVPTCASSCPLPSNISTRDSRCPTSSTRATSDWSRRPRSSIRHEASNSYLTRCGGYVRAFCRPSPNKAE